MVYNPGANIFKTAAPYTVATGGIEAFETADLTDDEESAIEEYLNALADEHITDTPITKQFRYETEKKSYAPWAVNPLTIETIEENKTIYQYRTFAAFPLTYDLGTRLSFMPTRTASGVEYDIIGVAFYEYGVFSSLTWH